MSFAIKKNLRVNKLNTGCLRHSIIRVKTGVEKKHCVQENVYVDI